MMQRVATIVETVAQDAMSKIESLRISFPHYGVEGLEEALALIVSVTERNGGTFAAAKKVIEEGPVADVDPLSQGAFFERAAKAIAEAEKLLASIPPPHREAAMFALNHAFSAGKLMAEARLRERHLVEVTREEEKMKPAWRAAGKARRGKFKSDTLELCEFMDGLIKDGMSRRQAAMAARRKGLGTSVDANCKRLKAWIERKAARDYS